MEALVLSVKRCQVWHHKWHVNIGGKFEGDGIANRKCCCLPVSVKWMPSLNEKQHHHEIGSFVLVLPATQVYYVSLVMSAGNHVYSNKLCPSVS